MGVVNFSLPTSHVRAAIQPPSNKVVYRARDEKLQRDVALKFLGTLQTSGSASHERPWKKHERFPL